MRRPALLGALLAAAALSRAEEPALQRYLASLYLGDPLEVVHMVYPPAREWPSYVEPRGHVTRVRVERESAKAMPIGVETLWLGFKRDRLVEVQLIYDEESTRKRSVEQLAGELALIYGEPTQSNEKYWWADGQTVIRVFYHEIRKVEGKGFRVELRTALQLMDESLFRRAR